MTKVAQAFAMMAMFFAGSVFAASFHTVDSVKQYADSERSIVKAQPQSSVADEFIFGEDSDLYTGSK